MTAITTALSGLLGAQDRFEASARRIVATGAAQSGTGVGSGSGSGAGTAAAAPTGLTAPGAPRLSPDLAGAMIDMLAAEQAFKANAAVAGRLVEVQREVLDSLAPAAATGARRT